MRDDEVTIILGSGPEASEASDALLTLANSLTAGPRVHILLAGPDDTLVEPPPPAIDLGDESHYPGWAHLLTNVGPKPPSLLTQIAEHVNRPELRGYPMLTSGGWWSLRLEGLEVGRINASTGWLDVGKDGNIDADGTAARSKARQLWLASTGKTKRIDIGLSTASIEHAADTVAGFATQYLPAAHANVGPITQNEHALESRILREATILTSTDGTALKVIKQDPLVNWGSQFPTKWGRHGSTRYLDAVLRDDRAPWAVEMKIQGPAGVGRYYRHAVAQAVLYRAFITLATPLEAWFDRYDLDQTRCRAAVVVPELVGARGKWAPSLHAVARAFDVDLIEIAHHHAGLQ